VSGRLPRWAQVVVAEVAAETGVDPDAVARETMGILAEARDAGMLGNAEAMARFLAGGMGIAPEALLAEAARIAGRW
jgi:deoxyribodipyrimidine photolyase-like uncharacterized protein